MQRPENLSISQISTLNYYKRKYFQNATFYSKFLDSKFRSLTPNQDLTSLIYAMASPNPEAMFGIQTGYFYFDRNQSLVVKAN